MSVHVTAQIWDYGPTDAHLRMLLLALGEFADDRGVCWPSVKTLAARCCVTERPTQRNLRTLEAEGWITRTQRPGARSTVYRIALERLTADAHGGADAGMVVPDGGADAGMPATDGGAHAGIDGGVRGTDGGVGVPSIPASTPPEPSRNHHGNRQSEPSHTADGAAVPVADAPSVRVLDRDEADSEPAPATTAWRGLPGPEARERSAVALARAVSDHTGEPLARLLPEARQIVGLAGFDHDTAAAAMTDAFDQQGYVRRGDYLRAASTTPPLTHQEMTR